MANKSNILEAINYVQQSRHIHVLWVEWLNRAIECCDDCRNLAKDSIVVAGDVDHHKDYIMKYDFVIKVLKDQLG